LATSTYEDLGLVDAEDVYQNESLARQHESSTSSSAEPMESTNVALYENVGSSTETHRDPTASDTGGIDVESYDSVGKFLSGTFNGSRNTPVSSQVQMHVTNADHQYEEVNAENQNSYSRRDTNFSPTEESKYEELQ